MLSPCFPVERHYPFKKWCLRGGSTFRSHSVSFCLSYTVFLCFFLCCLHHFVHFHIISSSSQIAVAQENCICWSDLAWLTPPPQKYGDVRVMLAWAQPSPADWVIMPVMEQDNHISKYSTLLSPSPSTHHYQEESGSSHALMLCFVSRTYKFELWCICSPSFFQSIPYRSYERCTWKTFS